MGRKKIELSVNLDLKTFDDEEETTPFQILLNQEDRVRLEKLAAMVNRKNRSEVIRWLIREAYCQNFK